MSKIERSIVIERSIQDVFDFVHDPTKDPLWQTTLLESQPLDEGPLRAGSRVREVRRFLGIRLETSWEVTEYEPPTRSAITSTSGPVPFTGGYALEPLDGGTRFTVHGDLGAHGFFKLAEPVFTRMATRELEANLGHLRDLLEAAGQ